MASPLKAPGQPAANGLGPDTTRTSFTLYGPVVCGLAPAAVASGAPASSSTPASSAGPATRAAFDLIVHPPPGRSPFKTAASLSGIEANEEWLRRAGRKPAT